MRMTSELSAPMLEAWESVPGVPWVAEPKRVSPRKHLARTCAKRAQTDEADVRATDCY